MESNAMTKMTQMNRVHVARPQDCAILLAGARGWAQGTTVSTLVTDALGTPARTIAPAFYVDGFGAPSTTKFMDVAHLRSGEPPV